MKQKEKNVNGATARSGSALILTTILLFVILGMVVSLTYVTVMEQKMSGKTKSSVTSFYNAESGIEWVLNKIATTPASDIDGTFGTRWDDTNKLVNCPDSFAENECKIYLLDQDGNVIQSSSTALSEVKAVRSIGTQGDQTQRAIEAAVAASDEKYRISCEHDNQGVGGQLLMCCQIEVSTGITKCQSTPGVAGPWSPYPNPWIPTSSGTWGISCGHDLDMLFCCRNDTILGTTECKSSDGSSWTPYSPISW